jgi:hypothetical protein
MLMDPIRSFTSSQRSPPSDGDGMAAGGGSDGEEGGGRVAEEAMNAEGKKDLDTEKSPLFRRNFN